MRDEKNCLYLVNVRLPVKASGIFMWRVIAQGLEDGRSPVGFRAKELVGGPGSGRSPPEVDALCRCCLYTVSQTFPPLNSLSLCQILTDFQMFCTAEKRMNLQQKPHNTTDLTLETLLHYLGKFKIQNFCRYSADMEENANKLHFVVFSFVIDPQILIFSVFNIASFLHTNCK